MATISVIIPVYKVELYLRKCVDSVLSQTFQDFELILVDDGSPDSCPLICDEYAKIDSRVVVIHKQNGGLSSARNAGLDWVFANSDSEYISFIDSDDYVDDQFLELLYKAIKDSDMSLCNFVKIRGESPSNYALTNRITNISKIIIEEPFSENDVISCCKLFKKEIFKNIRYPINKMNEDEFVIHRIVGLCNSISLVDTPLYFYRQRVGSIMSTISNTSLRTLYLTEARTDRLHYYYFENYNEKSLIINYSITLSYYIELYLKHLYRNELNATYNMLRCVHHYLRINNKRRSLGESMLFFDKRLYFMLRRIKYFIYFGFKKVKKLIIKLTKYEIPWICYKYLTNKPKVMSNEMTIKNILDNHLSISRFGDGEYILMSNSKSGIGFQEHNVALAKKLREVYSCRNKKLLICACNYLENINIDKKYDRWVKLFVSENHNTLNTLCDPKYLYGNTNFTRFYHPDFYNHTDFNYLENDYLPLIKSIWSNKNILLVEGYHTKIGIGNDLLDNALSIKRILCPDKNAFNNYEKIKNSVFKFKDNVDLVLISLGPTATVLSADLSLVYNIWSIDIGHIDIVYIWMKNKATTKNGVYGKNVNEKRNGAEDINVFYDEEGYLKQVVDRI